MVTYKLLKVQASTAILVTVAKMGEISHLCYRSYTGFQYDAVDYTIKVLTFKAKHGLGLAHMTDLVVPYQPSKNRCTANRHLLAELLTTLATGGDSAFMKIALKLCNKLPPLIMSLDLIGAFKRALKTHLFRIKYGW